MLTLIHHLMEIDMRNNDQLAEFIPVALGNGRKAPAWIVRPLDCRPLPDGGWHIVGPQGWNQPGQHVRCIDDAWGEADGPTLKAPIVGDVLTIARVSEPIGGTRYLMFEGREDWYSDDGFEPG